MQTPLEEIAVIGNGGRCRHVRPRRARHSDGNAAPQVRAHADFVTASNAADGFAGAVERFVLAPEAPAVREGGRR